MKKLIIAAAALMVSLAAYGQGQVTINNKIGTEVTARLVLQTDAAGSSSIGSPDWSVSFLGGPVGATAAQLVALDPPSANMRGAAGSAGAGYFNAGAVTVPNVAAGGNADVYLKVSGPNGITQTFGPYTATQLGGGVITPPNLPLGTSPLTVTVPEPTTLALGALGLGALLVIRRRK